MEFSLRRSGFGTRFSHVLHLPAMVRRDSSPVFHNSAPSAELMNSPIETLSIQVAHGASYAVRLAQNAADIEAAQRLRFEVFNLELNEGLDTAYLSGLDADRFEGRPREGARKVDVSDLMRRLTKEELRKFDGSPLFPERKAYTIQYQLSDLEAQLYAGVTQYVRNEMRNRAGSGLSTRRTVAGAPPGPTAIAR